MGANAMEHFGATGAKVARALKANAWSYMLVLRLLPVFPFFLVNVIAALSGVRAKTFVLATFSELCLQLSCFRCPAPASAKSSIGAERFPSKASSRPKS